MRIAVLGYSLAVLVACRPPPPANPPGAETSVNTPAIAPVASYVGSPPDRAAGGESDFEGLPDPRFAGTWQVEASSAEFEIRFEGDEVVITGVDRSDGEVFVVSDVVWTRDTVRCTKLMPSTQHQTHSDLSIIDDQTLRELLSGDASADETWTRIK